APVLLASANLKNTAPRYLLINSGNANAATGDLGLEDAKATCELVANATGVRSEQVLPFSTGVIGERLPIEPFRQSIPQLVSKLQSDAWHAAALAIMTTDTVPKVKSRQIEIDGRPVTLTGMAKGAGMIQPNMATMLCFIGTDVASEGESLKALLKEAADQSLNRVTVDSDTSTNDACVLMATGQSGVVLAPGSESESLFQDALTDLMIDLAQSLVRDGEGATKFVTVMVNGAPSNDEALTVALSIANSPLVKTAIFAEDANWGRLVMAIGKVDREIDVTKIDIFINDVCLMQAGMKHGAYVEALGATAMKKEEIEIRVEMNQGDGSETVWTSDLSHEYVKINAEYRT
ncbi:MAG: bifunctional glutamate N-acetyltransferase/amino-acid acetyltransferase ArgJ, partial [Pseudomonadales bacterium]